MFHRIRGSRSPVAHARVQPYVGEAAPADDVGNDQLSSRSMPSPPLRIMLYSRRIQQPLRTVASSQGHSTTGSHHNRTRSSGEQRGIAVKAAEAEEAATRP